MLQQVAFSWTDENVEILKSMLSRGESSGRIAKRLHCSRNAVIGKAMRLQLRLANSNKTAPSRPQSSKGVQADHEKVAKTAWTPVRLHRASTLWKEGKKTELIAINLGCSVGALMSLASTRRDLFPKRGYKGRQRSAPPIADTIPHTDILFDSVPFHLDEFPGVAFDSLEAHHCRWPISNNVGPKMLCCGAKIVTGSYCGVHAVVSRGRGTESERKAISIGRSW